MASKIKHVFPSQEGRPRHFLIGCIGVSGKTKWDVLDGVVRRLFKVNINRDEQNTESGSLASLCLEKVSILSFLSLNDFHDR